MRKSIIFILSFLLVATCAAWAVAFQPSNEAYGFSSDDLFGGSSYLGVDTRDVTPDRLADLKLKEEHGVEVTTVDQDAPAGKAGIKEHDVILNLNGTTVESVEQLRRMIREVPPGRVVTLGISRNGQPLTLKAQLADRKRTFAMAPNGKPFKFAMPAMPAMGMSATKTVIHATDKGGGMYEGKGDLGSGGTWQVTIRAQQNGQTIASKQFTLNATGGM